MVQVTKQGQYCKCHERNSHSYPRALEGTPNPAWRGEASKAVTTEWRPAELAGVVRKSRTTTKVILTTLAKETESMQGVATNARFMDGASTVRVLCVLWRGCHGTG